MLKKLLAFLMIFLFTFSLAACGQTEPVAQDLPIYDQEEDLFSQEEEIVPEFEEEDEEDEYVYHLTDREPVDIGDTVHLDLTDMSATMVYSQVFDMVSYPSTYVGQVIKASGTFNSVYYDEISTGYTFIIINDATGCCPQGLEFITTKEIDLPEPGTEIELTGVFEAYSTGQFTYYRIVTNDITVL